ncbi:MAG: PAS domain S-box protein, partial [Acidobacteriota bacterium]
MDHGERAVPDPDRRLLSALSQALSEFISSREPRAVFDHLLEAAVEVTASEYGFVGEVLQTSQRQPYLKAHALTDLPWGEESLRYYAARKTDGLEFHNVNTLLGKVVQTGKPVFSKDPAGDRRFEPLPANHPPLSAFAGLPIYWQQELIGAIGLANRPEGYDQRVVDALQPLLTSCAYFIVALRTEAARARALRTLRESEARGRAILESTIDGIVTIDESGLIETCNPATEKLFGYCQTELVGMNVSMLMPEPERSRHDSYIRAYRRTGRRRVIGIGREVEGARKDGSTFTLELAVNELQLDGRKLFVGVLRDISQRKRNEEQLTRLNSELSRRVEELRVLATENTLLSEFGGFLQASHNEAEASQVLLTYARELFPGEVGAFYELNDTSVAEFIAGWGEQADRFPPAFSKHECWALRRGEAHVVGCHRRGLTCSHLKGDDFGCSACVPVMTQDGPIGLLVLRWKPALGSGQDKLSRAERNRSILTAVADRLGAALSSIQLRERLQEESIRDPLTRLFNRRFLDESLRRELRRAQRSQQPLSLILGDLDRFKQLNDEYGHETGDVVLR